MNEKQKKGTNSIVRRFFNLLFGKKDDSNPYSKRPLISQLVFTALAFLALNVLTYNLVRNVISSNLLRNAESVFTLVQNQVENDLNNLKTH